MSVPKDAVVRNFSMDDQIGGFPIIWSRAAQTRMNKSIWGDDSVAGISVLRGFRAAALSYWLSCQLDLKTLSWGSASVLKHNADLPWRLRFIAWRDLADCYPGALVQPAVPLSLLVGILGSAPESDGGKGIDQEYEHSKDFSPFLKGLWPPLLLGVIGFVCVYYGWRNLLRAPCHKMGAAALFSGFVCGAAGVVWLLRYFDGS